MSRPSDHPSVAHGRVGILLVNLGTPEDLSVSSVRRYLKEFLSDSRVVEIPKPIWWLILNGVILQTRPKKSAANYAKVWLKDPDESPLRRYTRLQAEKLAEQMPEAVVDYAMRYGNPSIPNKMAALKAQGCDRIVVVPLYPQYSSTTTASVNDAVFDWLKTQRWQPSVRIAHPWYDHPNYIDALAAQVEQDWQQRKVEGDRHLLLSFHGLPKLSLDRGDPYYCQCMVTGRLLAERLKLPREQVHITFQSRFGPAKWLEPYTVDVLAKLPKDGIKQLTVMTPGFVADCLETLEEIGMEGVEIFTEAGGEHCQVLPCLNDSDGSIQLLKDIATREADGWLNG